MSSLPARLGIQKLWITSALSRRISTGRPAGRDDLVGRAHRLLAGNAVAHVPPPHGAGDLDHQRRVRRGGEPARQPELVQLQQGQRGDGKEEAAADHPAAPAPEALRRDGDGVERQGHDGDEDRRSATEQDPGGFQDLPRAVAGGSQRGLPSPRTRQGPPSPGRPSPWMGACAASTAKVRPCTSFPESPGRSWRSHCLPCSLTNARSGKWLHRVPLRIGDRTQPFTPVDTHAPVFRMGGSVWAGPAPQAWRGPDGSAVAGPSCACQCACHRAQQPGSSSGWLSGAGGQDARRLGRGSRQLRCARLARRNGETHHAGIRWCGRSDSNRHSLRNRILSPARLPISPRPQRRLF